MILRIWHGWTTPEAADDYETLLRREIFEGIVGRRIAGFRAIEMARGERSDGEVGFVTLMWFDDLAAVAAFAGDDWRRAVVPPAARALLSRFDATAAHYEVRERRDAD